jgi:hypothetical protein
MTKMVCYFQQGMCRISVFEFKALVEGKRGQFKMVKVSGGVYVELDATWLS